MSASPVGSLLRIATRPILYLQFLFVRQILKDSAFPTDAGRGLIEGPDPKQLIVIGEATAIGYLTLSHQLGIAGHLARQFARSQETGVEWSTLPFPDFTVHTAASVVTSDDAFTRADLVILMLGIGDSIRVTPVRTWQRLLGSALSELRARMPSESDIVIAEIPPLDISTGLPRAVSALAGRHARALNLATREVVTRHERCSSVPFPEEHLRDLRRPDTAQVSRVYSSWAAALLSAVSR